MRKIQIIGNLTRDAEVRSLNTGKTIISFDIACNERYKDKHGQKVEKVYYIQCALWRDNTSIAQYLLKGTKVYVEGTPEIDAYINKENKAIGVQKITVGHIELLESKTIRNSQYQHSPQEEEFSNPAEGTDLPF